MKLNKFIYVVLLAVMIITAGTGCRKGQFNINQNINNPTDSTVTYDIVLPAALNASGSIIARQWGSIQNWMSWWARSGTYAPNVTEETYQITTGFGTGVWNACYDNNYDYQIVQSKAALQGADFYAGIARIMKAINFQILVDVYGNVPYSQALKGSGNPTPAYDNGLDIYKDLFRQIDTGIGLIKNAVVTASNPNKGIWFNDIMFGSPTAAPTTQAAIDALVNAQRVKWAKFGNTIKLRLLIHAYAESGINKVAEMAKITADGNGFLGAGENVFINPGYSGNSKPQPFFNQYITNTDGSGSANNVYYRANKWGIDYYAWNVDPRQAKFYVAGSGGMVGVQYGLPPVTANSSDVLAGIGPGLNKGATAAQMYLSSAESFFLQSEARERGIITSGPIAADLMKSGVYESFLYMGLTTTQADNYILNNSPQPDVCYTCGPQGVGAAPGGIFTTLSQKWCALNGLDPLEVWTDWRRVPYTETGATKILSTGGPAPTTNFVYGDGGGFGSDGPGPSRSVAPQIRPEDNIPVRYLYPQSEYNYNTANVAAQGTITRYSRIFWDKQ
jgi:Starch-binding associating with outer membrane